jgi:hypothetical protein
MLQQHQEGILNPHAELFSQCASGDWSDIDTLITRGADPAWTHNKQGIAVVHLAAAQGNVDAVAKFYAMSERYVSVRDAVKYY